jgi:hypothetical protein
MTLKQQIEATIAAYQEACKDENLNFEYCFENKIEHGICYFSNSKSYFLLSVKINEISEQEYICKTPISLFKSKTLTIDYLEIHQIRLQFLQNLLNSLTNDSDN